jgi:hypothetical protein
MPTIAVIDGITIAIYYNDHDPPHFHAKQAAGSEILVEIARLRIFARRGGPSAAMERTVLDWAGRRQSALALCWVLAHSGQPPGRIA